MGLFRNKNLIKIDKRELEKYEAKLEEISRVLDKVLAERDEALWVIERMKERLDKANAKLKKYGHLGEF